MSRKCIIEKYLHKARFCGDRKIEVPYNDLTMMCHFALDSLQASGWIPVSERLPDDEVCMCLVYKIGKSRVVALFDNGKFWELGEEVHPTHWMPLPEPPGVE